MIKLMNVEQRAYQERELYKDIASCRNHIVSTLNQTCLSFTKKNKEPGDIWDLLLADFAIVVAAIKKRPDHIPTMATGLIYLFETLKDVANQKRDITYINLQEYLAETTYSASTSLINIYGRKITEEESKEAVKFIESIKWDSESKSFISSQDIKPVL